MFVRNELLFNNAFLNQLTPTDAEKEGIYSLMRSARAWLKQADFSTPSSLVETFFRPFLLNQSLELISVDQDSDSRAFFLAAPWDPDVRLGILYIAPRSENMDGLDADGRLPKGSHWMIRAVEAARAINLRWAVLSDGERWRLLDANGLRRYEAYLDIDLLGLAAAEANEHDFEMAAYLFARLFRLDGSFQRDPNSGTFGLDDLLEKSQRATESAERYLKQTVCDHLDTPGGGDGIMAQLCMGLVKAADPDGVRAFTEAERDQIYRDATYLLYRLLFILYAEARGLLPADNPHYQDLGLRQLMDEALAMRADPGRAAARPTYLWDQLAMLFNLIDIGDPGPAQIPAYDGGLFDDAERPFLRGCKIENVYLAEALAQLAFQSDPKNTTNLEPIDYRDLSVRHLGSLYEGMIEYRLFIAEEELLARAEKNGRVRYLPSKDNRRQPNDEVVPSGRVYFAQSPQERKATGTHYTPENLVEKLVRQTVLRLIDERWADFEPEFQSTLQELDKTPPVRIPAMQTYIDNRLLSFVEDQILSLRICDPAMGSGHFLVHTAHQLTNAILHTLARTDWVNSEFDLSPSLWRRHVVERCLYGVDINPMAVELAKLSLWLASMTPGRPLSFLDHRLKAGNSLLGVRFEEIVAALQESELSRATKNSSIAEARGQYSFNEASRAERAAEEAVRLLDSLINRDARSLSGVEAQKQDYRSAKERLEAYRRVADFLTASKMGVTCREGEVPVVAQGLERGESFVDEELRRLAKNSLELARSNHAFHWSLEFPDVFLSTGYHGFSIVIGNPPFLGGSSISSKLGNSFLSFLKTNYADAQSQTDLCAYFMQFGFNNIEKLGFLGMVTTNTISQGDTRITGLSHIVRSKGAIEFAEKFVKWVGEANVEVNLVVVAKTEKANHRKNHKLLDGQLVPHVSSRLDDLPETEPKRLFQNSKKAFLGDSIKGIGFVISPDEADRLLRLDPNNQTCIFPFPNGVDINNDPLSKPSRFVICFFDWKLEKARLYPDLLKIVEEKVKPQREKTRSDVPVQLRRRKYWWLFGSPAIELYRNIEGLGHVLTRSRVSEFNSIVRLPNTMRFGDSLVIFAFDDFYHFSILQSWIHEVWLRRQASTMRTDIRYTPTDCFHTFPFPQTPILQAENFAEHAGKQYYDYRLKTMQYRHLGLTKTYNLFHNSNCQDDDMQNLRRLHVEMDNAVLSCYGWDDIELRHDFYPNDRKKIRFMPCREAQREIFSRLMDLNHQIAEEEAAHGMIHNIDTDEDDTEDES